MHDKTYCDDLTCSCHYDVDYHADVTGPQEPTDEEMNAANDFFGIEDDDMEGAA